MKQAAEKDVYQLFAEKVRDHKDLECRWATLQETRVEYFRGKDFVCFLKNHPELKELLLESDRNLDMEDIVNVLLSKNLIVRCDRVVKTVRPRKRKLSTWPAHLEIFPDQVFSGNDAFFAWAFVKQMPLWQTILTFLWFVLTLASCLVPLFPRPLKRLAWYLWGGALLLMLAVLVLRWVIFGTLWIILGKRVWIFPNICAEYEAELKEVIQFWPQKDEDERPKWNVSNIIDDVLEWSPKLTLSGMMEKQQTVVNATETNYSTEGFKARATDDASSDDTDRTPSSYQYDDKEPTQSEDDVHT